jgi:hypothetical protein
MPLVVSTLSDLLEASFVSYPGDAQRSADGMAMAYDTYCKSGLAGGVPPLFTGLEKQNLMGILLSSIMSKKGTPDQIAQAWSSGIQTYWMSPPVVFTAPPIIGVVTAMPGAGAVIAAIKGVMANTDNTAASAAQGIAAALDAATKTVLVTFSAPPPPTGPPPPAMVV